MIKLRSPAICRSRWFTPLICLGLGAVVFAVSALGGQVGGGLISLAILAGFGLIMLLAALVGWLVEVARGHNGHPYDLASGHRRARLSGLLRGLPLARLITDSRGERTAAPP